MADIGEILNSINQLAPAMASQSSSNPQAVDEATKAGKNTGDMKGNSLTPFMVQLISQLLLGQARNQMGIPNNPGDLGSILKGK